LTEPILTAAQLAEVQAYYAPRYLIAKVAIPIDLAVGLITLRFFIRPAWRWAERTVAWLQRVAGRAWQAPVLRALDAVLNQMWKGPGWGTAMLFIAFNAALGFVLGLPSTLYFGYFHEHAFGLSNYTPAKFLWDLIKGQAIGLLAVELAAFAMFAIIRRLKWWWLIVGLVVALTMIPSAAIDPYRAQVFFDQEPLPAGPMRDQITALMKKADVDFKDVLVEKNTRTTKKVQAYFAGRGPTRTIVLNDALLQEMQPDEVLAAVAHEAGHTRENKWPGLLGSGLAMLAFLFVIDRTLRLVHRRGWFGATEVADVRALPLIFVLFFVLSLLSQPLAGYVSREREREADRFALALTQDPEAFQRMLRVACRVNKMDPDPPRWYVLRGSSHPPILERYVAAGGSVPP
jgi:STE24 endopeptidase